MEYSDSTNLDGIVEDIDFLVDTNSSNYPIEQKTRNVNGWYRTVMGWIWKYCGDWDIDDSNHTDLPIATTTLVEDQINYNLPAGYMKIDRLEVKDASGLWTRLIPFDKSQVKMAMDEFQKVSGLPRYYDLMANSLMIYPASDAGRATALKLYFGRDIDAFAITDTTQEPGFNKNFHRILSHGAALDYALANEMKTKVVLLRNRIKDMKAEIENYYKERNADLAKKNVRIMPRERKPAI